MRFRTTKIMLFAVVVLLALALAACSPTQATEAPAESGSAAAAPTAENAAAPTTVVATAAPAANEEASAVSMNGPEGCMAFNAIPAPDPTLEALFPPPGADDHTRGPAGASVVITEYSDFQ